MRKSQLHRRITEEESPGIIVYPNRRRILGWMALSGVPALFFFLAIVGMIVLMIAIPDARNGGAIFMALLLGGFLALSIWMTRMFLRVTFSGEPTLTVNHAGIRVGKIYGSFTLFLPWEEVEAVYCSTNSPYTLLCIRPVDSKLFFARLSPLMRFTCRLSTMSGAPIALYQSFLDQPVEEILEQMQIHYRRELQLHKMKRPEEITRLSETGEREIILYATRWHLLAAAFLLGMAPVPGLILIFIGPRQLSGLLISLLFLVGGTTAGSTLVWNILRVPVLLVDDEGIASPRFRKRAKIRWEEIDAVYCGIGERNLTVDASPAGIVSFLTRQNNGRLIIPRDMDITVPQTVFAIPQSMLPLSAPRVLESIKIRFQDRLEYYKIATDIDEP